MGRCPGRKERCADPEAMFHKRKHRFALKYVTRPPLRAPDLSNDHFRTPASNIARISHHRKPHIQRKNLCVSASLRRTIFTRAPHPRLQTTQSISNTRILKYSVKLRAISQSPRLRVEDHSPPKTPSGPTPNFSSRRVASALHLLHSLCSRVKLSGRSLLFMRTLAPMRKMHVNQQEYESARSSRAKTARRRHSAPPENKYAVDETWNSHAPRRRSQTCDQMVRGTVVMPNVWANQIVRSSPAATSSGSHEAGADWWRRGHGEQDSIEGWPAFDAVIASPI